MRIFSKKALQFDHPKGADAAPPVVVQAGSFESVPDWVKDSTMFKWATADGDVEVITNRESEIAAETGSKAKTKTEKEAEAKAKKEAKAKADAEVKENLTNFALLTEDEQKVILQGQEIEPGSSPDERVQQYTELLQKEDINGQQQ